MLKRRSTLRSAKLAQKKKRQRWVFIAIGVFVFVLIIVGLSFASRLSAISISHIEVEGDKVLGKEQVEHFIRERISGNYAYIFAKKNIFLYPKKNIERELLASLSRVESVDISLKNLSSIVVSIKEREPFALWCKSQVENERVVFGRECYFLDEEGVIFSGAPVISGNVYLRYYGIADNTEFISLPLSYLTREMFAQIYSFVEGAQALGLVATDVYVHGDGDVDMYTEHGGIVFFSTRVPVEETLRNLESLLYDKATVSDIDGFIKRIDYIDLRFGKKLFLKLK